MDAVLIDAWLAGLDALPILDEAAISAACDAVRACGVKAGLGAALVERVALAARELVQNQVRHARRGHLAVRAIRRGVVPGIEIIAADQGPGIADPAGAIEGLGPPSRSPGGGLPGVRRLTDEIDVDTRLREGTCIRARAYASPQPRRREVGILGRALARESMSGDHAAFVRDDGALVVAVADGIGHGPPAHDAAGIALGAFLQHAGASLHTILDACDAAATGTRGAVMAVARIDESTNVVQHAAVGNVLTRIERVPNARILSGSPATLGARGHRRRLLVESITLEPGEVLMMYTDGLTSRVDLSKEPHVLREHPIVIAQRLIAGFARPNDDALVLVVR